jgi:hypothetical protein
MILNLEESLNMRGRKVVEKKNGFPPKKLASNFFSSKMVVTIRFYTLESVENKLEIL